MMKNNKQWYLILIGVFCIQTIYIACSIKRSDRGYSKIQKYSNTVSAEQYKKDLLSSNSDVFVPFTYLSSDSHVIKYRLLSPAKLNPGESYPLVLVLHSSGQIGTDNFSQLGLLAKLWATPGVREKYPAYVVAPQFPTRSSNYIPLNGSNILTSSPDSCLSSVLQLIDSLTGVLPVDKRKIYVIGFSMGASTAINSVSLRPDLFAAAVSISGIPEFKAIATLAKTPVWFIHGNTDTENPIKSDSLLYTQLQLKHAKEIRYWEIDQLEHTIYPPLFMEHLIPQWLFRHKKQKN